MEASRLIVCIARWRPTLWGTYFRKRTMAEHRFKTTTVYHNDHNKVEEYASRLIQGIKQSELITTTVKEQLMVDRDFIDAMVKSGNNVLIPKRAKPGTQISDTKQLSFCCVMPNSVAMHRLESHAHLTLKKWPLGASMINCTVDLRVTAPI